MNKQTSSDELVCFFFHVFFHDSVSGTIQG